MATVEKLGNNKAKLTITVDKDTFAQAMQKSYIKNAKLYNVPGFRKGKAPRKVIENMYGEGVFYEDAFEFVYGDAYDKAIEENELIPVDQPDVSIASIGASEDLVFTAEVTLKPEVSLGQYKGIEVVRRAYTVEDAEVNKLILEEQEKAARYLEQERPVEDGDRVVLDYSGAVDGVKFDGGTAEDQALNIGSNSFIPGFEEQLVGMNAGETKDINVKFPDEYHAPELSGKDAVFTVTIKSIQVKELPELDDDFVQDISEFDTMDALRADKREQLMKRNEQRAKNEMENEALEKVMNNATIDVPAVMIDRQTDYAIQDLSYRLSMSGLSLEDYCMYTGSDMQKMRESFRDESENRVRLQLVLEAIGKAENIEPDEDAVEAEIVQYVGNNGLELDKIRPNLTEEDIEYFRSRAVMEKTIKIVMDNVVLVDAPEEPAAVEQNAAPEEA